MNMSAYSVRSTPDGHVNVMYPPTRNDCLGVNKQFELFLEMLVSDKGFSRYLKMNDPATNSKHSAHLNDLVNRIFEGEKVRFECKVGVSTKHNSKFVVRLPFTFVDVYQDYIDKSIRQMKDSRLKMVGQDLQIEYSKMADFFEPVVDRILENMSQMLRAVDAKVDIIYLVGEFARSNYIYQRISMHFRNNCKCIAPHFAVVCGAVLFRQHTDVGHARRADATYGVGTIIPFDPLRHDTEYKWINDGEEMCSNIFSTVVERGDLIYTDELFSSVFMPALHRETSKRFKIYSTLEKDVWYTSGKREKIKCITAPVEIHTIGEFVLETPVLTDDTNRKIEIMFDFTHTEIHVKAYDRTSEKEVKVTLDFLTT